jgi:hypothetical protein
MTMATQKLYGLITAMQMCSVMIAMAAIFIGPAMFREWAVSEAVLVQQIVLTLSLSLLCATVTLKCNLRVDSLRARWVQSIMGAAAALAFVSSLAVHYSIFLVSPHEAPYALGLTLFYIGVGLTVLLGLRLLLLARDDKNIWIGS